MPARDKKQKKLEDCGATALERRQVAMAAGAKGNPSPDSAPDASASGSSETPGTAPLSSETLTLLAAMQEMRGDLSQQIGALAVKMGLMQAHVDNIAEKQKELENRFETMETKMPDLVQTVDRHEAELAKLRASQDELEGRNRRSNVRIIGMPESVQNQQMETFLENLIPKLLPAAVFSNHFVIERAHRSLTRRPPAGAPPRAIILKLLNYRDRDTMLAAARLQGDIRHDGHKISFFPDLTPAVQQQRRRFDSLKAELRKRSVPYAMFHPAKLRIIHNNTAHFFTEPKIAWDFVEGTLKDGPIAAPQNMEMDASDITAD